MKSVSVVTPKLLKFLSFCPRASFLNRNLNKSHCDVSFGHDVYLIMFSCSCDPVINANVISGESN